MREFLRYQIPSMFHRRLLLLVVASVGVVLVLVAQTARLTVGNQHYEHLTRAQQALERTDLIPTVRGRILDRHDRVLAADRPGHDVAVNYSVIAGRWAEDRALAEARRDYGAEWKELSPDQRDRITDEYREDYDQQTTMLWQVLAEIGRTEPNEVQQRKNQILRRVQNEKSHLGWLWHQQRQAELQEAIPYSETMQAIAAERQAHSILRDVSEDVRLQVRSFIAEADRDPALEVWSQVELRRPKHRRYPLQSITPVLDRSSLPEGLSSDEPVEITVEGVGLHIIGLMRQAWREDLEARPFRRHDAHEQPVFDLGGYLDGDRVGRSGIERSMEHALRGTRGRVVRRLDTGQSERIEPTPGRDIQLTVDAHLQARIQALMKPEFGLMQVQPWHGPPDADEAEPGIPLLGDPLYGAAVVLEVDTGEVLASVSSPGYSIDQLQNEPDSVWQDPLRRPGQNRPTTFPYPPGSTLKPMILAAAMTEGLVDPYDEIECVGPYFPYFQRGFRCWIHHQGGQHGPLDGAEALARSCNIYFYTLADQLGPDRIESWLQTFGLGQRIGSGVSEIAGHLPLAERFQNNQHVLMGIGQGPVTWTVLQSAAAYATVAQGGVYLKPTFVRSPRLHEPEERSRDLNLHPQALPAIMQGLEGGTNERYGTAHLIPATGERIFNAEGIHVMGKSGTAQAPPTRDENNRVLRRGNHAWFIGLVQAEDADRPQYVISVVVEHGDSGGTVAGPVANQIIHALKAEGYL